LSIADRPVENHKFFPNPRSYRGKLGNFRKNRQNLRFFVDRRPPSTKSQKIFSYYKAEKHLVFPKSAETCGFLSIADRPAANHKKNLTPKRKFFELFSLSFLW